MKNVCVLLIDDDPIILAAVSQNLREEGLSVVTADNGESALRLLENQYFDIVITDLVMDAVNGIDVLRAAKQINFDTIVIILTGHADTSSAITALRLDADDYIMKPCKTDDILFRIKRCMDNQKQRYLSGKLISLLEEERRRVARELHDEIGQTLTSLKIHLEVAMQKVALDEQLHSYLKNAEEKAAQAIREVKNISQGLRPSMLDNLGLIPSMRDLVSQVQQHKNIRTKFYHNEIDEINDKGMELALYRITQESLNNIVKYAYASNIFVTLLQKEKTISLTIEDDGVGFDPETVINDHRSRSSMGLSIMRERAVQVKGECRIESHINRGTNIVVEIPL